jgi:hypothetical protein
VEGPATYAAAAVACPCGRGGVCDTAGEFDQGVLLLIDTYMPACLRFEAAFACNQWSVTPLSSCLVDALSEARKGTG